MNQHSLSLSMEYEEEVQVSCCAKTVISGLSMTTSGSDFPGSIQSLACFCSGFQQHFLNLCAKKNYLMGLHIIPS